MYQNDSVISTLPQQESFSDLAPKTKFVFKKNKIYIHQNNNLKSKSDSLIVRDSLIRVDSLQKANQKKLIQLKTPSGHQGNKIPSFPGNENWVFIAFIFLLFLFLISLQKSRGHFFKGIKNLFKKKDSFSTHLNTSANILEYRFYFTIFLISIISLYVYESFYVAGKNFDLLTFTKILSVNILFYTLKILLIEFIGNVFFNKRQIKSFKDAYFNLVCMFSISLFPFLILRTYNHFNWMLPFDLIAIILLVFFHILLLIKVFQIFFTKILDSFYIFLYLCTLEILPLFVLFQVYNLIV